MNSLTPTLGSGSKKPLYEQIYEYIKQEMKEGKLLCGEKLPSTRSLAEYLQVSRSTVDLAYSQLVSEGYIEARPYKGYFVCQVEELYQLPIENDGKKDQQKDQESGPQIDFSTSAVDLQAFPFDTWRRIYRKVFATQGERLFMTGEGQGDSQLRQMLCKYLHSSRGVNCEPDQVIVGAGNDYLLMLLEKLFGDGKRKRIALETPTYQKASRLFASFGYEICPVEMDSAGMCIEQLAGSGAELAYVMPSHQYPTGIVMPIGRRLELLKWAAGAPERYLIEDDYDSEFRYRGKPVPALQASDRQDKVIYIGTFSKSLSPAIRISYLVLPRRLLPDYRRRCGYLASTVQRTEQAVLAEFLKSGGFERHLNRMRKVYRDKHDFMLQQLAPFQEVFDISGENAGLHLLLTDKKGRTEERLIASASEKGVQVYGMRGLRLEHSEKENREEKKNRESGAGMENKNRTRPEHQAASESAPATVLLGYGGLSKQEIERGIKILAELWL